MRKRGIVQKKIMLVLMTLTVLGLSYDPRKHFYVYKNFPKELRNIKSNSLRDAVVGLEKQGIIKCSYKDGKKIYRLTKAGKKESQLFLIELVQLKQEDEWDGKWRIVVFDVPEQYRVMRNLLRKKLKQLGFLMIQKSVFVFPYKCKREIQKVVKILGLFEHVYFAEAKYFDDDKRIREHFKI